MANPYRDRLIQMKGYVDVTLAAPILVMAAGNTGEELKRTFRSLFGQTIPISLNQYSASFKSTLQSKKMNGPDKVRAKYLKCKNVSEFLLFRDRLRDESQLFHLKCYSILIVIDVSLNKDTFRAITEQTKAFLFDDEAVGYLYYRAWPELAEEFRENDRIGMTFHTYSVESAIDGINNFAASQVVSALEKKIRAIPNPEDVKKKSIEQIISTNVLKLCSVETSDVVGAFSDAFRQISDSKDSNSPKVGAVYELMGMFEREFPGVLKTEKLQEKVSSPSGQWAVSDSASDATFLFAAAAEAYAKAKPPDAGKVTDVLLRIVASGGLEWIDKCVQSIKKNVGTLLMSARAWELMNMTARQGRTRKVTLLAHLFQEYFSRDNRQAVDFTLEVIRLLGEQTTSPVVMRELFEPAVTSLFTTPLDPARICSIVLDLLSRAGTVLSAEQQGKLFKKLEKLRGNDFIIPCNLGLQAGSASFGKSTMTILKPQENKGVANQGPFLYSFFGNKNTNLTSIEVGIGWPVKVELELLNPFQVDLPATVMLRAENCKCRPTPLTLPANSKKTMECTVFPQVAGDFEITSFECQVYEGLQIVDLPRPLTGKVYDDTVKFACRTDLPIEQSLRLFVGERLSFHIWITNTGMISIDTLEIKFTGNLAVDITPIALPITPSDSTSVDVSFTVSQGMKEVSFTAIAGSANGGVKSVISVQQPIDVQSAIVISSIEPALSLPASNSELSELIFLAVNISNYSDSVFNYSASFAKSAQTSLGLKGIVSDKVQDGILASEQTTAFILAVEKDTLREASEVADAKKVMNAVKQEEELKGRKISSSERPAIRKRVGIASFIESNLILDWKCGGGRRGRLTDTATLPVPEVLDELALTRPHVKWTFAGSEENVVGVCQPVEFVVTYEATEVTSCAILLGKYMDPDFGVAWNGSLTQTNKAGDNKFSFVLFFAKPGEFTFQIEYHTNDDVTGQSSVTVVVQ